MESLYTSLYGEDPGFTGQCAFVFKSGLRCKRVAVDDDVVCLLHGGNIETATISLQRRMLLLQEQSLSTVEELLANGEDRIRSQVAIAILDRTGLGPKSAIERKKEEDFSGLTMSQIADEFEKLAHAARGRAKTGESQSPSTLTNEEAPMASPAIVKRKSDQSTH